jgi:hypothetical protein
MIFLIPIGILGILLLYSYYYFGSQNKTNVPNLWGSIKEPFITLYYGSMFLSAFGFLCMLYYVVTTKFITQNQYKELLLSLVIIIGASLFWMPLSLTYIKKRTTILQSLIIFILLTVALFSLNTVKIIVSIHDNSLTKRIALISMIYFFFHVFVLDTITWSYNFF